MFSTALLVRRVVDSVKDILAPISWPCEDENRHGVSSVPVVMMGGSLQIGLLVGCLDRRGIGE